MATSVDIAPAVGHPVMATQLGIGATPGYDAIDLRRLASQGLQSGVHDSLGWQVTEATPNSLNVIINANVGIATVQGTSIVRQGRYVVAPHSGTITLTLTTAHASLPRLDQIILRVYDTAVDGLGLNKASAEVLTGTATSGATLDNRNGAATLPANAIRLADIVVAANATTIANAVIRDRRPWGNGATFHAVYAVGDQTTTSATFQALTLMQARIELSSTSLVAYTLSAIGSASGTGALQTTPLVDGASLNAASNGYGMVPSGTSFGYAGFSVVDQPGAGSHLFTAAYRSSVGGQTVSIASNGNRPASFWVQELIPQQGNNGTV